MHPGLYPVGMTVVGFGERESDEPHCVDRPHPGQGLCCPPDHKRVREVQQQTRQSLRGRDHCGKGRKVTPRTNTLRRGGGQRPVQGAPQLAYRL